MPFTPANPPDLAQAAQAFSSFCQTVAMLRDPKKGCPWDLQQTHKSLKRYLLEECYEAIRAIEDEDVKGMQEELGDVLLQVVLHAQFAHDDKNFSIVDVVQDINEKMRRRHPHVFAPESEGLSADEVTKQWESIKGKEKNQGSSTKSGKSYFERGKIHKILPPSEQALAIGKAAKKIAFDWSKPSEVMEQFKSEVQESVEAFADYQADPNQRLHLFDELSDVYFTLAQLCRHLDFHPDEVADAGNRKFLKRFQMMEDLAEESGIEVEKAGQKVLEDLWLKAKQASKP